MLHFLAVCYFKGQLTFKLAKPLTEETLFASVVTFNLNVLMNFLSNGNIQIFTVISD